MRIVNEITATVGQLIKDLKVVAEKYPDHRLYMTGHPRIYDGLVVINSKCYPEYSYIGEVTVKSLLDDLSKFDHSLCVVYRNGPFLCNLERDKEGALVSDPSSRTSKNEVGVPTHTYNSVKLNHGKDVRLYTGRQLLEDLSRFEEGYSDKRVVFRNENGKALFIRLDSNFEVSFHGIITLESCTDKDSMTVSSLIECLRELYRLDCETWILDHSNNKLGVYKSIDRSNNGIFFVDEVNEETVIACRLSETICKHNLYCELDD